jgi:hypothetical protein
MNIEHCLLNREGRLLTGWSVTWEVALTVVIGGGPLLPVFSRSVISKGCEGMRAWFALPPEMFVLVRCV